jgi:hypothetical protein
LDVERRRGRMVLKIKSLQTEPMMWISMQMRKTMMMRKRMMM